MDIIKVVCGIIYKDNKIFLCRKKPNKSLGGYWEFPGGKIENNEKYEDALERELSEEINMSVIVNKHFKSVIHSYEKITIELIAYKSKYIKSTFTLIDHDKYEWVDIKNLLDYNLAPADIPIAQHLIDDNK